MSESDGVAQEGDLAQVARTLDAAAQVSAGTTAARIAASQDTLARARVRLAAIRGRVARAKEQASDDPRDSGEVGQAVTATGGQLAAEGRYRRAERELAEARQSLADIAQAIANVEDEVADTLDHIVATAASPERAESRSRLAQRAREYAVQERALAEQ